MCGVVYGLPRQNLCLSPASLSASLAVLALNGTVGGSLAEVSGRLKIAGATAEGVYSRCIAPPIARLAGDAKWELSRQSLSSRTVVLIASNALETPPSAVIVSNRCEPVEER